MPHFVRLPLGTVAHVVEAVQWLPGRGIEGVAHETPAHPGGGSLLASPAHAFLITERGRFTVFVNDWVVTEPDGRRHVCQDGLFRTHYVQAKAEVPTFAASEASVLQASKPTT